MASLKQAIRAKCKDCTYDQLAPGTYLQQIEQCNVKSCALWHVRPVSTAAIAASRKQKVVVGVDVDALLADLEDEEVEA